MSFTSYMSLALEQARAAAARGEVPVGAVIVAADGTGGVAQGARVFSHAQCHHAPDVYDAIAAAESEELLKTFFAAKRKG